MFGMICGVFAVLVSLGSALMTFRLRRKLKLFKAHILVPRAYLHSADKASNDGNNLEADLLLDAADEELEKAKRYA